MKILIDLQGAQAENCKRGIGRYSMSLAMAMVRNCGSHQIALALNGCFPDSIEFIKNAFSGALEQKSFHVWENPAPSAYLQSENKRMREAAELMRESFLASLNPDILHISSLFEGLVDNAIVSIRKKEMGAQFVTAVTLYDVIPYIFSDIYLKNSVMASWYNERISNLKRSDLLLGISRSSIDDAIKYIKIPQNKCVNISADADEIFKETKLTAKDEKSIRDKYKLNKAFVMYSGGIDHRKNVEGLIRAYSKLPRLIREQHQLAIVCSIQEEEKTFLKRLSFNLGLEKDELVLTGFVPDADLIALYNICTLFIFPSWYEGFGLPILEAMRCGAPVVGANTSSVAEIICMPDAIFNPHSEDSIVNILKKGLQQREFQDKLRRNGKIQSNRFCWDKSAREAIAAMEETVKYKKTNKTTRLFFKKPKLAYVSPMFPTKSGISYYSEELAPNLSKYYDLELIVADNEKLEGLIKRGLVNTPVQTYYSFLNSSSNYDRIIYHIGNSDAHMGMFHLLQKMPGVVVLHDFFLSGIYQYMEQCGYSDGAWSNELYNSHGYGALREKFINNESSNAVWKYPCSLSVIQNALGLIVHSENSVRLSSKYFCKDISKYHVIPHLRTLEKLPDRLQHREILGINPKQFLVCSFGIIGKHKLSQRLCDAWRKSDLAKNRECSLIFVGENAGGVYGEKLLKSAKNIKITGWVSQQDYQSYLSAADLAVQLRALSRGETSGAVLDCMNFGLPTIVNAHGSMEDHDKQTVMMISDQFSDNELVAALHELWKNHKARIEIGARARAQIEFHHHPEKCAKLYHDAIEEIYESANSHLDILIKDIGSAFEKNKLSESELIKIASCLSHNFPQNPREKVIFIDISELVQRNVGTGIQRVVTMILMEALNQNILENIRFEPVYATEDQGYTYARNFTSNFMGYPAGPLKDEVIDYSSGDLFLGLDLQPQIVHSNAWFFKKLRNKGVDVRFVVYDLLCVLNPEFFVEGAAESFKKWLDVVCQSDGVICISRSVANEFKNYFKENKRISNGLLKVDWFHLGCDINQAILENDCTGQLDESIKILQQRISFLMVGTIEPRKGHNQILETFEILWKEGLDLNLVFVGKQGWMVDDLCEKIRAHAELNHCLFWLEGISDEYLEKVYSTSTCLIAASYGEGFGLPLIEAAQHGLPILARDIPVFREVAGEHATYFKAETPEELAAAIKSWLADWKRNIHSNSSGMSYLTWKESAAMLFNKICQ